MPRRKEAYQYNVLNPNPGDLTWPDSITCSSRNASWCCGWLLCQNFTEVTQIQFSAQDVHDSGPIGQPNYASDSPTLTSWHLSVLQQTEEQVFFAKIRRETRGVLAGVYTSFTNLNTDDLAGNKGRESGPYMLAPPFLVFTSPTIGRNQWVLCQLSTTRLPRHK